MTQMYIAIGRSRSLRREPLSFSQYRSSDCSKFLPESSFFSPHLIEDILGKPKRPEPKSPYISQRASSVISKVEEAFKRILEDINRVKISIIARIVSFPEENLVFEQQELLRNELERCRQRVISSKFSPKVLEEFALLVSEYNSLNTRKNKEDNEDTFSKILDEIEQNLEQYRSEFGEVLNKIKKDVVFLTNTRTSSGNSCKEGQKLVELAEENTQKKFDYLFEEHSLPKLFQPQDWLLTNGTRLEERKLPIQAPRILTSCDMGIVSRIWGKECLILLLSQGLLVSSRELIICHKDSKAQVRKRISMTVEGRESVSETLKIIHLEELNQILVFDGEKVSLFCMGKSGLRQIAMLRRILSRCVEYIPKARKVIFITNIENLNSPCVIEVMDILTRKVVQEKSSERAISDCVYMRTHDSLAVVSQETVLIYKITKTGYLGPVLVKIQIQSAYKTGSHISCQGNLLVVQENYIQPGRRGIELSFERFQLILVDKRNKYQYEKCEVCVKDELWGNCKDLVIYPSLGKALISFLGVGQCLVELNMKKKISKLIEKEDYVEMKDHKILAKNEEGNQLFIAKKDGIYEWNIKL